MKRTLWTRNLFIGVLIGFVMVLGGQDTADAISRLTRSSGDLQTVIAGNDYQIRFTVSLQSITTIPAGETGTYRRDSSVTDKTGAYYYLDANNNGVKDTDETTTRTYTANHYYEQEQITFSGTGVNIKRVGSHDVPSAQSGNLVMYESTHNSYSTTSNPHQRLSGSVTLTLTAPTDPGAVEITITPATDSPAPPGHTEPSPLTFTIYVVPNLDDTTTLSRVTATTNQAWVRGNDNADRRIDNLFEASGANATNAPVIYKVEGPGRLYVEVGNRKSRSLQTLLTSKAALVRLDMNGGSNRVTIRGRDRSATESLLVIFNYAQIEIISGNDQTGVPDSRLRDPLGIRVKDAKGRPLSGLAVSFAPGDTETLQPVIGTDVYLATGNAWAETFDTITRTKQATSTVPTDLDAGDDGWVPTNRSGEAQVYLKLGAAENKTVTVSAGGETETFDLTSSQSTDIPSLEIVSGNNQRSASDGRIADPLMVRVLASNNQPLPEMRVTFTTTKGYLTTLSAYREAEGISEGITIPATINGPATQVTANTDVNGRAAVSYDLVEHSGAADVIAEISSATVPTYQRRVTFNINGGSSTRPPTPPAAPRNAISLSLSSSTGEPGDEVTVFVTSDPTGQVVTINSGELDDDDFSDLSDITPFRSTLTLPSEDGEYDFSASGPAGFTSDSATVTVETGILGRITISRIGQPSNGTQLFTITVRDTDGDRISSALTVTVSGSGFTTTRVNTQNGIGDVRLTLPTTAQLYTLTASAEDYTSGETQVRITASEAPQDTEEEEEDVEEEEEETPTPASIEISGPPTRTGTTNTAIEAALLVQVLDADDGAVEDARVIFRVRTGQGRLSQRGNGRAVAVQTDSRGYARADYMPISASSTVEAEVRGVRTPVTFTITATDAAPPTDTPDTGEDTPSDTIRPTVHTPAAQRPPMLWVAGGKIYSLVSTEVHEFAPNLNNVMNITIGGGKVYWTAKTSASSGTINSANLDGSGVKELKSIMAIPIGIAVDTTNSLLYWTNSRGRIQSANLDGSGIQNVMENIRNPNDLALAGGNVYWTESNHGSVRFVNLRGQKQIRVISTGDDPAGSLVIGGGKVYWTEKVGESGGTINSANLNGSGATELASILSTPIGIAVDTARSKLYWTNARGRVQSASLSGSSIRNVVSGLESPGEIVLSNSIKAPKTTTPTKSTTTTAAGKNKYDINGDGSVDDQDVDAIIVAVAAKITTAKYDVNGDGKVDFNDVVAVSANKESTASAPTLLGRKFSALEVDRLQEQIDLLIATGDRSPAAIKTLIYLQQLIAMARPEKTQLLANYPNPFNPETWMPYELATDTNVKITIYNTQGVVIRTLALGHQSAGYYTGRERAAYWDGRNAFGEPVASGIYFYQLETDEMSTLRKMVILK